ncbi:hypothetical protein KOJCDNHJ_03208 [Xanthomonas citri pv. punicae]|nr:hypothetical protein FICKIIDM_04389 [Xanthomonas citri pv. punicae]UIS29793.1 hypothetical protein KOJCDNHJ_03208 [Xanthomonas citri pv. punicae]
MRSVPDSDQGLVAKGAYFTVQDGVACGQHRTDCITFRYDRHRGAVVFHKRVIDVWEMDTQDTPDADALRLSEHKEIAADPGKPVLLSAYTPATYWRRCAFIRPRVAGSACSAGIMANVSVRGAPASRSSRQYRTESAQWAQRRRAGNAAKRGGRHPAPTGAQLQSQRTGLVAGAAVREMLMDVTNRLTGPN